MSGLCGTSTAHSLHAAADLGHVRNRLVAADRPELTRTCARVSDHRGMHIFVSYSHRDRPWAEWIAWQLEQAHFDVIIQAWDFRAGTNFVLNMQAAVQAADRTLLVVSPDYLKSAFAAPEWAAGFALDPGGMEGRLLPVRVRECRPPGLLAQLVYVDLVGLKPEAAREKLLNAVQGHRLKPDLPPLFPIDSSALGSLEPDGGDAAPLNSVGVDVGWYLSNAEPKSVDIFDVISAPLDPVAVNQRWDISRSTRVLVTLGVRRDGRPIELDLAGDGPCGVVLGPSGSGTSELLRVICMSLAVNYPPDRIRLHLIDFKGGGVWDAITELPHVTAVHSAWGDEHNAAILESLRSLLNLREAEEQRRRGDGNGIESASGGRAGLDVVLLDEVGYDWSLLDGLRQVQQRGRSLGICVIVAAQNLEAEVPFLRLSRFTIAMGWAGCDVVPSYWERFASSLRERKTTPFRTESAASPLPGRAMLVRSGSLVDMFQAAHTGHWEPDLENLDSLFYRNAALHKIVRAITDGWATRGRSSDPGTPPPSNPAWPQDSVHE